MRWFLLALLAAAAIGTSALLATQAARSLLLPTGHTPGEDAHGGVPPTPASTRRRRSAHARAEEPPRVPRAAPMAGVGHAALGPRVLGLPLGVLIAIELAGGGLGLLVAAAGLALRRARARRNRVYGLYRVHLSAHDEAHPQDLADMVETIAGLVRAFPTDRARRGQPFIAFELRNESGPSGALEWSLGLRCEPRLVVALDGALSATYPDVRLGHTRGEPCSPIQEAPQVPGHVMRFRKERSFVYSLLADEVDPVPPPLEAIAHAQVSLAVPSVVRLGLTPAPLCFEALARHLFRAHENRLARQERWGLPEGGLRSTLNRAEMTNAQRAQNRSLFWLEASVAAGSRETCRQLGAVLQARRGENRLHRRWMPIRHDLYRRRFPTATPPLVPSPRALVSAAEVAQFVALPSARMKGVPVRRVTVPRVPMPSEVLRADPDEPVPAPGDGAATAALERAA